MADNVRLSKVLRELNISIDRAIDFLESKNIEIEKRPTTKISSEIYELLSGEFQNDASKKVASKELGAAKQKEKEDLRIKREKEFEEKLKLEAEAKSKSIIKAKSPMKGPKTIGKIDLADKNSTPPPLELTKVKAPVADKTSKKTDVLDKDQIKAGNESSESTISAKLETNYATLSGPKSTGETIDLSQFNKPKKPDTKDGTKQSEKTSSKKKRRRISKVGSNAPQKGRAKNLKNQSKGQTQKLEPTAEEVQKQVRESLEKLQGKSSKGKGAKYRRDKRDQHRQQTEKELEQQAIESKTLKVTEFVTANEVATMMDVSEDCGAFSSMVLVSSPTMMIPLSPLVNSPLS